MNKIIFGITIMLIAGLVNVANAGAPASAPTLTKPGKDNPSNVPVPTPIPKPNTPESMNIKPNK